MATLVLGAAGAAFGAGFGGAVLGVSGAVLGRAAGATLGQVIDQKLLGSGSAAVEVGRLDRLRLTGATEGAAIARVVGRMRLSGQVIWASRFAESSTTSRGGKGGGQRATVTQYSYSVSLAIALCEGEISGVGRIWADGQQLSSESMNLRVYKGGMDQLPDPKIEAVEGAGQAPGYRGTAYVVIEDLDLSRFGNRVPQFTFEVFRSAEGLDGDVAPDLAGAVRAVAMMPGTGEYALATSPVHAESGPGVNTSLNINTPSGRPDFTTALDAMHEELPRCGSVSLVVSWFGDDLRCGVCQIKPKVEQRAQDAAPMPWRVCGVTRAQAETIAQVNDRPVYGGTPSDQSVIEAIAAIKERGQEVMFYPFVLMEQLAGNGRADPWSDAPDQAVLPWRGRVTLSRAPGQDGSPDGTDAAAAEVSAFFGQAAASDFLINGTEVQYRGPDEFSFRRFILHYAHLAKAAGGVDAFCIGSEMRGLTQIRAAQNVFPAVSELRRLAADVRAILGAETRISYAADWSEYFGYHPSNGDVFFHLDPLWADEAIDFIGIDNYMPLADWRDGPAHADAAWGSVYNLDYLKANIMGGEGFAWYYASQAHRDAQIRTPITDGAHDEAWIYRFKDIKSWWNTPHHERVDGKRSAKPTAWVPGSKPIWFTELGCAAIDKGANQPNKFLDAKSSESALPHYSNGRRDDLMLLQYHRAMAQFWSVPDNNPTASDYDGRMVDWAHAHVWAWDARPYPAFPNAISLWSDGENHARGHWLTGRALLQPLANVVAEICRKSGVTTFDVSGLYGAVRGYSFDSTQTARASLQTLMLAYGFDAVERDGKIVFQMRGREAEVTLEADDLAVADDGAAVFELGRSAEAETAGRVQLGFVEADGVYEIRSAEAILPGDTSPSVSQSDLPLVLTQAEGRAIAERWLAEAHVARDRVRFRLPPSRLAIGAGAVVALRDSGGEGLFRIDRVETAGHLELEAARVEPGIYVPSDFAEERVAMRPFVAPVPTYPQFLDLPLMSGDEDPHAPHLAVSAVPWPGSVALYDANFDEGYTWRQLLDAPAIFGVTQTALHQAMPGLWDRGAPLLVKINSGLLSSSSLGGVLSGDNLMAIGDGSAENWELFQFATATLVAPNTYALSMRLRGQCGTDAIMPQTWPIGSIVVLMSGAVAQISLPSSARGIERHYRIGPAQLGYDDPAFVHKVASFRGIGLRPYSPAHLRVQRAVDGGIWASWIRRARRDGDLWQEQDVPLTEASEQYLVQVMSNGMLCREETVSRPQWSYSAAAQASDGVLGGFELQVAQISDRFGAGPFKRIVVDE